MIGALEGPPAVAERAARRDRASALEAAVLVALLLLAAITRLPGLDARGQWDADQGTDMLVLRSMVEDGRIPLLGPRTSIGSFHHGAAWYWLLAPAALLSDADPVAVTFEIALLGIGAVAATWWLARLLGGPIAAAAAGVLMAVSPSGIGESTFIWNPNPIPLFAALAFAGAILARRTGHARWWLLAGAGAMMTLQLHVLGAVIVVPLAWAWVADLRARRRRGDERGARMALRGGLAAVLIVLAGYLPLLASDMTHNFAETRAILDYIAAGGRGATGGMLGRIVTVALRTITWPFAGVITDRIAASLVTALIVTALIGIAVARRVRRTEADHEDRTDTGSARWLVGTLLACVVLLSLAAPGLGTVTPGLPNDHYHNLLDPIVVALCGVGLARLAGLAAPGRIAAAVLGAVLAAVAVTAWPPAVSPDGGWPLADQAAARVLEVTDGAAIGLDGLPTFKNDNAMRFPLARRGADLLPSGVLAGAQSIVLVCDPLFDQATGLPCGGPAEDAWLATTPNVPPTNLVTRFEAGPRRILSIYGLNPG
jgi:4-amino-4-deoxy-L-arabinose transferase-like glycosyltransferase